MSICELIYEWLALPNVLLGERGLWRRGLVFVVFRVFTTLLLEPLAHGILVNLCLPLELNCLLCAFDSACMLAEIACVSEEGHSSYLRRT
jgi:hypothetical protein